MTTSVRKQDLIDIIATKAQTTENTAKALLNAVTSAVMEAISKGWVRCVCSTTPSPVFS